MSKKSSKEPKPPEPWRDKVKRRFIEHSQCDLCKKKMTLKDIYVDEKEDGVVGKFDCECGLQWGIVFTGRYKGWYLAQEALEKGGSGGA